MARHSRPDFKSLEVFLTVVETKSFAAAARQLGRSQPAVSQTIARLEEIFGGDLFTRRRAAPVDLTPIGRAILPAARTLLDTVDRQMVRAAAIAQGRSGALSVGLASGLIGGVLRAGIETFAQASPDVRLHFVEGHPPELYRQLTDRTVDLLISAWIGDVASTTMAVERLRQYRLVVALPEEHPLASKPALTWLDVQTLPLIQRCQSGCAGRYRPSWAPADKYVFNADHHDVATATIFDMVSMNLGCSVVLEPTARPIAGVAFVEINEPDATVEVAALWPADDGNSVRHRFLATVREWIETASQSGARS